MPYDVTVVRWLDGHRIVTHHQRQHGLEVLALRYEEQCLPGRLVDFDVKRTPRPWETSERDDDAR